MGAGIFVDDFLREKKSRGGKENKIKSRNVAKIETIKRVRQIQKLRLGLLTAGYRRTVLCNHTLIVKNGEVNTLTCKSKWCYVCNRINTAKRINKYVPALLKRGDIYHVTLTIKNVKYYVLRATLREFGKVFKNFRDLMRKKYNIKISGTRNIEVTYNYKTNEYHPHVHLLINGKFTADEIQRYWLKYWGEKRANIKAQKGLPIRDKRGFLECFKYANKQDFKVGKKVVFCPEVAHQINVALRGGPGGIRTFQAFGFKSEEYGSEKIDIKISQDKYDKVVEDGEYRFNGYHWVSREGLVIGLSLEKSRQIWKAKGLYKRKKDTG